MEAVTALDALAERVSSGAELTGADAQLILEGHDLITIAMMADGVRRRIHGARTTFLRVFEIHADAPPATLPDGVAAGEFRILGHPESADAAVTAVRAVAAVAGRAAPLSGFSLVHLRRLAGSAAGAFRRLCESLRQAGLDAIAELPIDSTGESMVELAEQVYDARGAGLIVARLTVQQLPVDRRIRIVETARALQEAAGGFRTFAPLPRSTSTIEPATGYDDVKQIALARLLLGNIDSIQVDWSLYGPKLAQVVLTAGADDVDGVAAFDPATLGARRSAIEEIRRNIRAASLEPVERNGRFEPVEESDG